jgi:DNA-binding CsgD family transcriptional regulator
MREVSVRALHFMLDLARAGGVDERALTAGLRSTSARNGAPLEWIDWEDYVELVERLERMLGGPGAFASAARAAAPGAYPDIRAFGAIFLQPMPLFQFVMTRMMRTLYRHLDRIDLEPLGEHSVRWEQTIPAPYRPSEAYHRATLAGVELFPCLLELPEAKVEVVSITPRSACFIATFPPPPQNDERAQSVARSSLARQIEERFATMGDALRLAPRVGLAALAARESAPPSSVGRRRPLIGWVTTLKLSPRQGQVFALLSEGRANKEIALVLGCSERNIEFHVGRILKAAKVGTRAELLVKVLAPR